ncbi:hypothetical protein [Oceaniradius stylonematis]|jgi:hypothetical protein|uniref:hypothetical protein n=1 Tax=Oceaniradius stylonematis TaxID=2184161 RepID=UPI0035D13387
MLTGLVKKRTKWNPAPFYRRWGIVVLVLVASIASTYPALAAPLDAEPACSQARLSDIANDTGQGEGTSACCRPAGVCSFGVPSSAFAFIVRPAKATWRFDRAGSALPTLTYSYFRPPRLPAA